MGDEWVMAMGRAGDRIEICEIIAGWQSVVSTNVQRTDRNCKDESRMWRKKSIQEKPGMIYEEEREWGKARTSNNHEDCVEMPAQWIAFRLTNHSFSLTFSLRNMFQNLGTCNTHRNRVESVSRYDQMNINIQIPMLPGLWNIFDYEPITT